MRSHARNSVRTDDLMDIVRRAEADTYPVIAIPDSLQPDIVHGHFNGEAALSRERETYYEDFEWQVEGAPFASASAES